jgi:putative ABC transport system ATP-binding protein
MINLTNITKRYKDGSNNVVVLENVNLSVKQGEFISILGPSGAGKSTLLNILGLLDKPTSGTYQLAGKDITSYSQGQLATWRNRHIGFVFQQFMLVPRLTVRENVELPLLYGQYRRKERKERVARALEQVGLWNKRKELPTRLSGGQKQRVAIARAIATDPEVLLADEPTGNLDVHSKKEVIEVMKNLHHAGKTIVLVTHDYELGAIADRILYVQDRTLVPYSLQQAGGMER